MEDLADEFNKILQLIYHIKDRYPPILIPTLSMLSWSFLLGHKDLQQQLGRWENAKSTWILS